MFIVIQLLQVYLDEKYMSTKKLYNKNSQLYKG